ncbi:branched chain amino acid aminotransferase [soil metagenome]
MKPRTPLRIAMWSGPRNISTALLRSWGNRPDTAVIDEPLYAHYLSQTGLDHPGADEVIASQATDWRAAVAGLIGEIPDGKAIYYQKHMAHHLLPDIGRDWLEAIEHAFLIREPGEMLTSLVKVLPKPRIEDTGLPQQVELFDRVRSRTGQTPPVIDARDVLNDPRRLLGLLCERLGVPFDEAMLSWPAGRRSTDGVWAKYWYENVQKSTTFQSYRPKGEPVPDHLRGVLDECVELYNQLHRQRLGP